MMISLMSGSPSSFWSYSLWVFFCIELFSRFWRTNLEIGIANNLKLLVTQVTSRNDSYWILLPVWASAGESSKFLKKILSLGRREPRKWVSVIKSQHR